MTREVGGFCVPPTGPFCYPMVANSVIEAAEEGGGRAFVLAIANARRCAAMPETEAPVKSLGEFLELVATLRQRWGLPRHKELWFRGESKDYGATILRPELYRPAKGQELKPIQTLLDIENDLHDEFRRHALVLCDEKMADDDWNWDSYFLMQHHNSPTRLLDWSDGCLMALHFALRNSDDDNKDARVYVLEVYRLNEQLKSLPDMQLLKDGWKRYIEAHPSYDEEDEDTYENAYLPVDDTTRAEFNVPHPPLVLDFPHITRRIAAQRSRFIVLGTEPNWLSGDFRKPDSSIKLISIAANARARLRQELRDCGVTESVIYPDLDGLGREMRQLWNDRRATPDDDTSA
jgi:hypothetical protein